MLAIEDRENVCTFAWRSIDAGRERFLLESDGDILAVFHLGRLDRTLAYLQEGDRTLVLVADGPGGHAIQVRDAARPDSAAPIVTYEANPHGANGVLWLSTRRLGSLQPGEIGSWRPGVHRRSGGFLCPDYVITGRDGHVRMRFGTDGTVTVHDFEATSATSWTELLAVLALGWLLILTAGETGGSR
jgi:hypothetical protein